MAEEAGIEEAHERATHQKAHQLSSLDAQFLAIEDARNFAHVSGLVTLDPSTAPNGAITLADALSLVEQRLHMLPPFRWKLQEVPFNIDIPYWVDDPDFDLEFHVRELALPAPGNDAQLSAQVERIVARPLDRARPLWEMYLIQGLSGGRVALLTKIHHAVVDGVSGAEILGTLFDLDPEGSELPPVPEGDERDRSKGELELFARGVLNVPARALNSVREIPKILPRLDDVPQLRGTPGFALLGQIADRAHIAETRGRDGHVLERPTARAPRSILNGQISAQRRFSFGSLSLDAVKKIKNVYGTTVNDVIVSVSTAALRDFLLERDELPDEPLVAMIPLSIRTEDQSGAFGNRVSAMIVPIPTNEPDPVERLRICHGELSRAKDYYGAVDAELLTDALNFIPPALYARTARSTTALAASSNFQPHYNVTISNIPGPPVPLYVSGATVEGHYPVSVVTDGMLVNITVFSYRGKLDFGVIGDRELAHSYDSMIESLRSDLGALERWADAEQVAMEAESKATTRVKPGARSKSKSGAKSKAKAGAKSKAKAGTRAKAGG